MPDRSKGAYGEHGRRTACFRSRGARMSLGTKSDDDDADVQGSVFARASCPRASRNLCGETGQREAQLGGAAVPLVFLSHTYSLTHTHFPFHSSPRPSGWRTWPTIVPCMEEDGAMRRRYTPASWSSLPRLAMVLCSAGNPLSNARSAMCALPQRG